MNDTRAVGQELQDQVLDAARKGRERVTSTVKTVTATAQHIRPQLANLPKPNLTMPNVTMPNVTMPNLTRPNLTRPTLPTPAQIWDKAPALVAKLPDRKQLMSGAQELAGHARTVQRFVTEQVRTVAVPLAHRAAERLAKVGAPPAQSQTTTRVTGIHLASSAPAKDDAAKAEHATTGQQKAKPKAKSTTK